MADFAITREEGIVYLDALDAAISLLPQLERRHVEQTALTLRDLRFALSVYVSALPRDDGGGPPKLWSL